MTAAAATGWLAVAFSVAQGQAGAATADAASLSGVSLTVQATCLVRAVPIDFGVYPGLTRTASTTITITCTPTTPYNVGLGAGTGTGATVATRALTGPRGSLAYALFSDAARSVNWGQTAGADSVAGAGTGAAQVLTVYGQVANGQPVAPGGYTDTITVTVTY